MSIKKCPSCKATFDASWKKDQETGSYICPFCGNMHDMDALDLENGNERKVRAEAYDKVYSYLKNLRFAAANDELSNLRAKYKDDSRVYFLSALADNCVCYTDNDDKTKWPYDRIPTLNNIKFSNILESEYVKKAISLAKSFAEKYMYQKTFEYMESVRKKIETAYKNGEYNFDVFISTKVNKVDENGRPVLDEFGEMEKTTDYRLAEGLYELIKKQIPDCKVFLSEKMKDLFMGKEYENIIFSALHTAKVFILVGNSRDNIESNWVRNEWMRYLYLMEPEVDDMSAMRNFVFVTRTLSTSDVPSEFKKRQHIMWGHGVGSETDLMTFVKEGIKEHKGVERIQSREFITAVGKMQGALPKDMAKGAVKFGVNYDNISEDVALKTEFALRKIEKFSDAGNSWLVSRKREAAFKELEALAKSHEDAYTARLYLLLRDTTYSSFDSYFSDINKIANNPDLAGKFFDNASEADAKKMLSVAFAAITSNVDNISNELLFAVNSIVIKYADHIDRGQLTSLADSLMSSIKKKIGSCDEVNGPYPIKEYLLIRRYLDGDDAKKYVDERMGLLNAFSCASNKLPDELSDIADEILEVDSGNCYAKWFLMSKACSPNGTVCAPEDVATKNRVDYSSDELRKKRIEDYKFLFSYAPSDEEASGIDGSGLGYDPLKYTKSSFLRAFITELVSSSWSHKPSDTDKSALCPSSGNEDYQLNGFDLFSKYIAYDLGKVKDIKPCTYGYDDLTGENIDKLLNPITNLEAGSSKGYTTSTLISYRPFDSYLSYYILTYAAVLHSNGLFDAAIKMYELYLAQQSDIHSFDCVIVRYYIELVRCGCITKEDYIMSSSTLDADMIKLDLFKLSKGSSLTNYEKVMDAIESLDDSQIEFHSSVPVIEKYSSPDSNIPGEKFFEVNSMVSAIQPIAKKINNVSLLKAIEAVSAKLSDLQKNAHLVYSIIYDSKMDGTLRSKEDSHSALKNYADSLSMEGAGKVKLENAIKELESQFAYFDNDSVSRFAQFIEYLNNQISLIVEPVFVSDNLIEYGLYPQTHVSDNELINKLNGLPESEALPNGYYKFNGKYYYPFVAKPYSSSCRFDDGTAIISGTKYWFRCDAIRWKILKKGENGCLVVSEKILDAHRYCENYSGTKSRTDYQGSTAAAYASNYRYSEIRTWLNTDFPNMAFALGSTNIKTTRVDNSAATTDSPSNKHACENTSDGVYLLGYKDYENAYYGFSFEASRCCKTTDFARARGAYSSTSSGYLNNGYYWTRSPHPGGSDYAWGVDRLGLLGGTRVDYGDYGGVRPAITLSF